MRMKRDPAFRTHRFESGLRGLQIIDTEHKFIAGRETWIRRVSSRQADREPFRLRIVSEP